MTVGLVIVSHSAQLAAGVVELAGQMTQGKTSIVAAGGAGDAILGTSADRILAAIESLAETDGILVLLDLGSAILSAEMALEMASDDLRNRTRLSFAPLVEGAIAAALEASLGHTLAQVQQAAESTASATQLLQLKPLSQSEEAEQSPEITPPSITDAPLPTTPSSGANTREITLTLTNPTGLHARPASLFVQTAANFQSRISLQGRGKQADATSIIGVLSLGARNGDTITIRAEGEDADAALKALSELVYANFYETTPETLDTTVTSDTSDTSLPNTSNVEVQAKTVQPPVHDTGISHPFWHGITTSAGAALGPAFLYISGSLALTEIERRSISNQEIETEQQQLREALTIAAQELQTLAKDIQSSVGAAQAAIFDAQALMLDDPELLQSALHLIEEQQLDAASALAIAGEQQATMLEALDDPLFAARAADVRDAIGRAIRQLRPLEHPRQSLGMLPQGSILIARDLTPSDTVQLHPSTVLGVGTVQGGPTAHAAILARALGIPALAGLDEAMLQVIHTGDEVGLDADAGLLYHYPEPEVRTQLKQRMAERQRQQAALKAAAQQVQAPLAHNGRHIHLLANIGSEVEAEAARQWGAEGVGLLRTEFLFASATTLPSVEEQRHLYAQVFRAFYGENAEKRGPIVVRTLDAGADKPLPALNATLGTMVEANPALGLRGIRISLAHEVLLEQQLSALLLAANDTKTNLHIMFPMITTVEELIAARTIFDRVYAQLKNQLTQLPEHIPVGIMVEVPAAAIMAAELAELSDFFSIGANDLLQYTLACDRTNATLASLYNPLQPAVLRLIRQVAEAGRRAGKPVAVCGEMASDIRLAPILVGLGVDELSMTPTALPAVRTALMQWSDAERTSVAEQIIRLKTMAEVEQAYRDKEKP